MEVIIKIPAVHVEDVSPKNVNTTTTIETHTETTVVIRRDVTSNPNFDHYLQPKADLLYDFVGSSGKVAYGGEKYNTTDEEATIEFDCYAEGLRMAAQQRAKEDVMHEVQVLAGWIHLAEPNYPYLTDRLQQALDEAAADNPDAEYEIAYNGGADICVDTTEGNLE